jgi:ABC-type sugar transport system permease subunit
MILVLFTGSFTHFTFLWVLMGGGAPEAGLWREANIAVYSYVMAFGRYLVGYGTAISILVMIIYITFGILVHRVRR